MPTAEEARAEVVSYVRECLVGPAGGPDEVVDGTPFLRYMMGMLFPRGERVEEVLEALPLLADEGSDTEEATDDLKAEERALDLEDEMLPSVVGLSFVVSAGATLVCSIEAGRYHNTDPGDQPQEDRTGRVRRRGSQRWRREPLGPVRVEISAAFPRHEILGGTAEIRSVWRPWRDGSYLVTVALCNAIRGSTQRLEPSETLFQVGLACEVVGGSVLPYPVAESGAVDGSEDQEVAFLYRKHPPFARGHGAAAGWEIEGEVCRQVSIQFMPQQAVRTATFEIAAADADPRFRDIGFLASCSDSARLQAILGGFVEGYEDWIETQRHLSESAQEGVGLLLAERAAKWAARMRSGVSLLAMPEVLESFRLANRAMGIQMKLAAQVKMGPYPASANLGPASHDDLSGLQWRPFQVAFLLGTLESLVNGSSADRDSVDVVWFPTGGGKTEAYLLVAAFELIRRRFHYGALDTATAILTRYTLRLLTSQQFERTGSLVAALELIRAEANGRLGDRPFSLGLWVGQSLTHNRFVKALDDFEEQLDATRPLNKFMLTRCPMCGTEIFPCRPRVPREELGIRATPNSFSFFCPSARCPFHEHIPLQTVDEGLYRDPPSILLGTLDKFAILPWNDRPRSFFGGHSDDAPPPSLVIQDELHLISGPLGSLAAPCEMAIDSVIRLRSGGVGPKVIASTATIRNAREQVLGLYGRPALIFPGPVRTWDDAYFFRLDSTRPGRLYVGVMAQGYVSPTVAAAWTAAGLLQAVKQLPLEDSLRDGYWTLLSYMNSRRELGRMLNAATDEIPARLKVIAVTEDAARELPDVMELSSQMTRNMSDALTALARPHSAELPAVDLVPCTSIISVGVDVDRLGLMQMNGQPKLTSEYIQATSRVGRTDKVPGLVFTLYSSGKPRDRSHYEDFRGYHESLYRFVEPTSVTPYAPPSRNRTLHAALVALVRHWSKWHANDAAATIDLEDEQLQGGIAMLVERMGSADPAEAAEVKAQATEILEEWHANISQTLLYDATSAGPQFRALLRDFSSAPQLGLWPTMRSVRNVDEEVSLLPVAWS